MAQFDVHRAPNGTVLIDCPADSLTHLNTRVVVPLLPVKQVPPAADRLHPLVQFEDETWVVAVQMLASVPARHLGPTIGSLEAERYAIMGAVDLLLTGV